MLVFVWGQYWELAQILVQNIWTFRSPLRDKFHVLLQVIGGNLITYPHHDLMDVGLDFFMIFISIIHIFLFSNHKLPHLYMTNLDSYCPVFSNAKIRYFHILRWIDPFIHSENIYLKISSSEINSKSSPLKLYKPASSNDRN